MELSGKEYKTSEGAGDDGVDQRTRTTLTLDAVVQSLCAAALEVAAAAAADKEGVASEEVHLVRVIRGAVGRGGGGGEVGEVGGIVRWKGRAPGRCLSRRMTWILRCGRGWRGTATQASHVARHMRARRKPAIQSCRT
jgi:hypothetical protein